MKTAGFHDQKKYLRLFLVSTNFFSLRLRNLLPGADKNQTYSSVSIRPSSQSLRTNTFLLRLNHPAPPGVNGWCKPLANSTLTTDLLF